MVSQQDSFVAGLLNDKFRLTEANKRLESAQAAQAQAAPALDASLQQQQVEDLTAYSEQLETELEQTRTELLEKANVAESASHHSSKQAQQILWLENKLNELDQAGSVSGGGGGGRSGGGGGPPYILVLIDGSSAPFADGLITQGQSGGTQAASQVRWEVEKDLRAFDIHLEGDTDSGEPAEVLSFVYYNKTLLVQSLIKERVISSGATFDAFALAFNSSPNCTMTDIGATPVEAKMASLIKIHAPTKSLKRIYLVGIHPTALLSVAPQLAVAEKTPLSRAFDTKVVAVNHRESESDRIELQRHRWRVTVFARFFSPSAGLGSDWGWGLNGDEDGGGASSSQEDSEIEYGYSTKTMQGTGKWTEGGSTNGNGASWKAVRKTGGKGGKSGTRKLDPNRGFLNQDPQICVFYYLSANGCTQKRCDRCHDYELSEAQMKRLTEDVGKTPCKEMRTKGTCTWKMVHGTKCMYSHEKTKWKAGR